MDISIVTTLYGSSDYIPAFYGRAKAAAEKITDRYEIIFVNDGSPDDSLSRSLAVQKADPRVTVVDLSRNFGHHKAMMAGLSYAKGKKVFLIDSDLEEEPELLESFNKKLTESGADVVYGVQDKRKGPLFERLSGAIFFKLFNLLSATKLPSNLVTARLMTRRYVQSLLEYKEREILIAGLWELAGYRQIPTTIVKGSKGVSSYNLSRKIGNFVQAVTSFSDRPLSLILYVGLLISLCSALYISYLIYRTFVHGIPVPGYASVLVSIWFLGGLTILFIGVVGIYLAKVYLETKGRPSAIVRDVYRS